MGASCWAKDRAEKKKAALETVLRIAAVPYSRRPSKGWGGHMATCADGMAHDLRETGHTHLTAINPVTDPDAAPAVTAVSRAGAAKVAAALAAVSPCPFEWPGVDGSPHLCHLLGAPGHQHMCSCGASPASPSREGTDR